MGYTTDFEGVVSIDPPLTKEQVEYLQLFSETRRMKRDPKICEKMEDPKRISVGLPVGIEGEFFVGGLGFCGQDDDSSVVDSNNEPRTQHSLWCDWTVNDEGTVLEWNGSEKFYSYVEWLEYIIENFMKRWNRILNGTISYQGEDEEDFGVIYVRDNIVERIEGE